MNLYFELKKVVTKDSDKEGTIRAIIIQSGAKAIISTGIKMPVKDWAKGQPKQIGKNANIRLALSKYSSAFDKYFTNTTIANRGLMI